MEQFAWQSRVNRYPSFVVKAKIRSYQGSRPRVKADSPPRPGADDLDGLLQGGGDLVGDLPPAWARSGRPPPPPPTIGATSLSQLPACRPAVDQVFRQPGDELDLAVGRRGQQDGQPVSRLRRRTSINWRISSGVDVVDRLDHDGRAADRRRGRRAGRRRRRARRLSVRRWRRLLLERLDSSSRPLTRSADLRRRDAQRGGELGEDLFFLAHVVERGLARQGGDPPRAGGDRLLADDLEQARPGRRCRGACRRRARARSRPSATTRTMSGYFSPKRAIAPRALASAIGIVRPAHRRGLEDPLVDGLLDRRGAGRGRRPRDWRSRTAAGRARPCCRPAGRACPGCVCRAWCRRCVAVVRPADRLRGGRRRPRRDTASLTRDRPLGHLADVQREVVFLLGVDAPGRRTARRGSMPVSPTWPPDSP